MLGAGIYFIKKSLVVYLGCTAQYLVVIMYKVLVSGDELFIRESKGTLYEKPATSLRGRALQVSYVVSAGFPPQNNRNHNRYIVVSSSSCSFP